MKFNYKTVIATTAFIALINPLTAGAGIKSNQVDTSEVSVFYSQAELSSAHGRARIERQIRQAAGQVCGERSLRAAGSLQNVTANKACYNDAVENAMNTLNGMAVTSL